jgi:hypothetical protein
MKTKFLLLLVFVAAVLACTSSFVEAQAEDTYNFYFQKAPGPTVVNQGVAGPTSPGDFVQKNPAIAAPAIPPSSVAQAMAAEESPNSYSSVELSLGFGGSQHGGGEKNPYGYRAPERSGMINAAQYTAGLQWNLSEHFALQAEAFYLTKPTETTVNGIKRKSQNSLLDYGGGLVITPFRLKAGANMRLAFSALAGAMSVPFHKSGFSTTGAADGLQPQIAHAGSFAYGGRLSLELWNKVALQATVRKIQRFDATHGVASLAFLL